MTDDPAVSDTMNGRHPVDVDRLAEGLCADGTPFARVTVVRREPPVSATVGDRAIVTADGELHGWIGGAACAQSVAVREAQRAIEHGEPTMVAIAPDPADVDRPGVDAFPMSCHSEGILELFIEPVGTEPRLIIAGDSPTAHTLASFAGQLAFDVTVIGETATGSDGGNPIAPDDRTAVESALADADYVVIASMGAIDEEILEAALRVDPGYVGLVASDDRASSLLERVAGRLDRESADVEAAIVQPAGVDIGATTAEEISIAVLAELIAVKREGTNIREGTRTPATGEDDGDGGEHDSVAIVTDPVCGMDVRIGDESATVEFEGEIYRFCATGCAEAFEAEPERFLEIEREAS